MTCRTATSSARAALIADIGGTNVRFALAHGDGRIEQVAQLLCRDYANPAAAAEAYLEMTKPAQMPKNGAFGVACVVDGDHIALTNHRWSFSIEETRNRLGLERLRVINDVQALTLAVSHLSAEDKVKIGGGTAVDGCAIAIVAPGTGLGASAIVPGNNGMVQVASEAGHVSMPVVSQREAQINAILARKFGQVSAERVISGPGLVNLYTAICEIDGVATSEDIDPATVSERGGSGACPQCAETLRVFSALLGTFAADIALTFCAQGGVYIGGGVVPKLGDGFDVQRFRQRFEQKGRYAEYLSEIPTELITLPNPALVGLARVQ
jgi:glucokinase